MPANVVIRRYRITTLGLRALTIDSYQQRLWGNPARASNRRIGFNMTSQGERFGTEHAADPDGHRSGTIGSQRERSDFEKVRRCPRAGQRENRCVEWVFTGSW